MWCGTVVTREIAQITILSLIRKRTPLILYCLPQKESHKQHIFEKYTLSKIVNILLGTFYPL